MKKILIATTNKGKIKELKAVLGKLKVEVIGLDELDDNRYVDMEVDETGDTFAENARIKAETWGKLLGMDVIADDSGLEVEALDGAPGVLSKRYGNTDEERNIKLLKEMEKVKEDKRQARFVAVLAYYESKRNKTHLFEGAVEGKITTEITGTNGFGYDPVFWSKDLGKVFAEVSLDEKNKVSHRGRALVKLVEFLKK